MPQPAAGNRPKAGRKKSMIRIMNRAGFANHRQGRGQAGPLRRSGKRFAQSPGRIGATHVLWAGSWLKGGVIRLERIFRKHTANSRRKFFSLRFSQCGRILWKNSVAAAGSVRNRNTRLGATFA